MVITIKGGLEAPPNAAMVEQGAGIDMERDIGLYGIRKR